MAEATDLTRQVLSLLYKSCRTTDFGFESVMANLDASCAKHLTVSCP